MSDAKKRSASKSPSRTKSSASPSRSKSSASPSRKASTAAASPSAPPAPAKSGSGGGRSKSGGSFSSKAAVELTSERRPIFARDWSASVWMAAVLTRMGVSANAISVSSSVFALFAMLLLQCFSRAQAEGIDAPGFSLFGVTHNALVLLLAAKFILMRLLANMLDGMVAIGSGNASPLGEILNELPDRLSDVLILVGAGHVAGSAALGWMAACLAVFVAYVRALGASVGVGQHFEGPMAKQQRMFAVIGACVASAAVPWLAQSVHIPLLAGLWWLPLTGNLMAITLQVIVLGCVLTIIHRTVRIVKAKTH